MTENVTFPPIAEQAGPDYDEYGVMAPKDYDAILLASFGAVSYTHLTLPTILLV